MKKCLKFGVFLLISTMLLLQISAISAQALTGLNTVTDAKGDTIATFYETSTGLISRIDLFWAAAITDYGNPATTGSIGWALAQLSSTPALIHLHAGTYPFSSTITINQSIQLEGDSTDSTTIQANGTNINSLINVTASNVSFTNIAINANGQGGNAITVYPGLSGFKCDCVAVENAAENGLNMTSNSATVITNSSFKGNGRNQFYMTQADSTTTDGVQISNSVFDDTGGGANRFVAVLFDNYFANAVVKNILISGNIIRYTGLGSSYETDGLVVSTAQSAITDVTITGNTIQLSSGQTDGNSIEIGGVVDLTLTGNVIDDAYIGIRVEGESNGVIVGNTINGSTLEGIGSSSNNMLISGNQIVNYNGVGIDINASKIQVVGNSMIPFPQTTNMGARGIRSDCSGSCNDISITDNVIDGGGNGYCLGIYFASGSFNDLEIKNNHVANMGGGLELTGTAYASSIVSGNSFIDVVAFRYWGIPATGVVLTDDLTPLAFANLPSPVPAAASRIYCSDCTTAPKCAGLGSGHFAVSNGSSWTCQ